MVLDKKETENDKKRELPEEGRYKLGCWAPSCLQVCNNAIGFLVAACVFYLFQSFMTGGIINLNVSSVERRFGLSSTQSALVVVGYDISFCVVAIFISYFGARASRPKIVAIGSVVFSVGSFIYALPHITTPLYDFGNRQLQVVCAAPGTNGTDPDCTQSEDLSWYMGVLLLGTLLMGCGMTPMFTAGIAFIEDSVSKHKAPLFLGIVNAASILGPMVGFLVGGEFLLKLFVDFDKVDAQGLRFFDPRWVGAWWLAPLIAMGGCFLVAVPLFGFPRQLPGTNAIRAKRKTETHQGSGTAVANRVGFGTSVKDLPQAFLIVIKNPVFLLTIIGGIFQAIVINGNSAFMTKFIENEFHLSVGRAGQLAGAVLVPAGAVGHIIAGIIINRMRWKIPAMLKFSAVSLLLVVAISPAAFIHCNNAKVPGVAVPYKFDELRVGNLTSRCNSQCKCQEEFFIPVCGEDGNTYFSPCHAGCFRPIFEPNVTLPVGFSTCSCLNPNISSPVPMGTVTSGRCDESCTTLNGFLAAMFFAIMFSFVPLTPVLVTQLRAVPESLRTFALGVLWFFVRAVGTIPGPFIYGAVIDTTCLLWQTRQCDGTRGSCWLYDNRQMAIGFVCLTMVGNFLAGLFYFIACLVYKAPPPQKKDNDGGETNDERPKVTMELSADNQAYENDRL